MATKKNKSAMDYIVSRLKRNPKVEYAKVKAGAEKKKLTVYPIMYGRAKLLLGLVKAGKGVAKKKAAQRGPGRPRKVATRGPGRPRKKAAKRGRAPSSKGSIDAVRALVTSLETQARDNERLRATLAKVRDLIARVV